MFDGAARNGGGSATGWFFIRVTEYALTVDAFGGEQLPDGTTNNLAQVGCCEHFTISGN